MICVGHFFTAKKLRTSSTPCQSRDSVSLRRLARRLINPWSSGAVHWKDNFMLSPMIWFSGKENSRKVPRIQREKTNFGSSQILMEMLATLGDLWATLLDGWSSGVVRWKDNFLLSMMIWFSGKESSEKLPRILREKTNFEPSQTIIVQRLTYSIAEQIKI